MKRKLLSLVGIVLIATNLTGCNKQIVDLNYTYNYAIIQLQNGDVVEGSIDSWKDYEGAQLPIKIDGVTYLTNSYNCTLINK